LLIKYIKGVLWRVAKRLSYIEEARCLKVKRTHETLMSTCVWRMHYGGVANRLRATGFADYSNSGDPAWERTMSNVKD